MTGKTKISILIGVAFVAIATVFTGCKEKDEHVPPSLVFKSGGTYTSADAAVVKNDTITVGIIADKTEDELRTYNVSYAFDGAGSSTTKDNFTLTTAEENHYEKDYTIITRNVTGSEKWIFTITDRDGNIASQSITLTVN